MGARPMTFERCVQVIERAGGNLAAHASTVDLDSRVPTCPEWSVASLLTHQGMVHRWAASNLLLDDQPVRTETEVLATVPPAELLDWYRAGVKGLLQALQAADPDVPAQVFLNDAPAPRHFWARRQAHETTIHSVDALAAAQGRVPSAEEADVSREVALDGIDELLTGFFTRGRSQLSPEFPLTIVVAPIDSDRRWTLTGVGESLVTERTRSGTADATFTGTASQLYLGLWNRGAELSAVGRAGVLGRWREVQHVLW